ncbi:MAG: 2-C-methyl-D-erythritol 2,4-cyclodiphosphate synthase [Huintestinicola sp.]
MRIGHGYDVHKVVPERKMILGGVQIPYNFGLLGHSDADVLSHAIMDALLGACAMGDIGQIFPDDDIRWLGANSIEMLSIVMNMIKENGYRVNNIDATIICERPKLAPFINDMRKNIADACGTDIENISVKATTEEKLGFTGAGQGIAVHAVCLVEKD